MEPQLSEAREDIADSESESNSPWGQIGPRWGHPWHSMCSYLGTFPPALACSMLALLSSQGDIVMDPFSGRGTTLLEARRLGRIPLASDLNPIAVALSRAKNATVDLVEVVARIEVLRSLYDRLMYLPEAHVQGDDIQLIYHPDTLAQLCYLRRRLIKSTSPADQFILGALLGIMHGAERQNGTSGYASISMPNTFSMAPNYVRRFVETKRLNRCPRDVFQLLKEKVDRLFREPPIRGSEGVVVAADAKQLSTHPELQAYLGRVSLIVTSPPYLDVVNYAKQNWIRAWLLDGFPESRRAREIDDNLTLRDWLDFLQTSVTEAKKFLRPDGVMVVVVGDVARASKSYISLAREFVQRVRHNELFNYVGLVDDYIGKEGKTTRIWKETKGRATEIDRVIVLSDLQPRLRIDALREVLQIDDLSQAGLERVSAEGLVENMKRFTALGES